MPTFQKDVALNARASVAVAAASTLIIPANASRLEGTFINDSDAVMYLGFDTPAIFGRGKRLDPGGSYTTVNHRGAIYAIQASGTAPAHANSSSATANPTSGAWGVGTRSLTHAVSAGSNRLLVAKAGLRRPDANTILDGVTYDGVPLLPFDVQDGGTNAIRVEIWYLIAPALAASGTLVFTRHAGANSAAAGVLAASTYTGVDQTTPFGAPVKTAGVNVDPTVPVAAASSDLVMDAMCWRRANTAPTASIDAGHTSRHNVVDFANTAGTGLAGSDAPGAVTVPMDWTLSLAVQWASIGVPLKPVGATKNLCYVEI